MKNCVSCFEEVDSGGLRYPSWQFGGEKYIHKRCLLNKVQELCQDEKYEKMIKYIIAYEEEHSNDSWAIEYSGGSADSHWSREDLNLMPHEVRKLLNHKVVGAILSTNKNSVYALCGREEIKQYFQSNTEPHSEGDKITAETFSCIAGYEEDKKQFVRAINRVLRGGKPTHFLLEGVPSSGKSSFIDCTADALGGKMYIATGANTTEAGLTEMLMREYAVVAIDEIDFLEAKSISVLLRFMESGDVIQTKHTRVGQGVKTNTMVLGACNSVTRLPKALISRFYPYHLYFPPYTKQEFSEVCAKLLTEREGVKDMSVAKYIANELYESLGRNTDPRAARGLARQLERGTMEEVDEQVNFLKKRGKHFVL